MKKIYLLLVGIFLLTSTFAASSLPEKPLLKATEIYVPIGKSGQKISIWDLSRISIKDAETISGRKMNLWDRLNFKLAQHRLKKNINPDGTLNNKRLARQLKKGIDTEDFNIGGFALGLFLGPIGVLIAYLIDDDRKSVRLKWAWLGLAAFLAIWLLVLVL
jgi:hypothetical protein